MALKPLINKEVIILNLLEEKTLMKLIVELIYERKAITSLCETIEND